MRPRCAQLRFRLLRQVGILKRPPHRKTGPASRRKAQHPPPQNSPESERDKNTQFLSSEFPSMSKACLSLGRFCLRAFVFTLLLLPLLGLRLPPRYKSTQCLSGRMATGTSLHSTTLILSFIFPPTHTSKHQAYTCVNPLIPVTFILFFCSMMRNGRMF